MNPGVIYHVDYVHHRVRPEPRTLHFPFASVWDMSCHHFDNLMFWLGPIEAMTARAYAAPWSAYRHPNNTAAWLEMQNGTRVDYLHTHDAARSSLHIEFQGERGALWWDGTSLRFSMKPNKNWGHCEPSLVPLDPEPGLPALLLDFYTYVTGGPEPGISGFQNLETMAACEMLVRSATLNTRITRTLLNYS